MAAQIRNRGNGGFTLLELLVVISLLGIVMGLSVATLTKVGTGNVLLQASNKLHSLLDNARSFSVGNDHAFVSVDQTSEGTTYRAFRQRLLFNWHCEDLKTASQEEMLKVEGGVQRVDDFSSGEGRHVRFDSGARVSLGVAPPIQLRDGFDLRCRLNPLAEGRGGRLFRKVGSYEVRVVPAGGGLYDVEVDVRIVAKADGTGAQKVTLRTGQRSAPTPGAPDAKNVLLEMLPEWEAPLRSGTWQDLRISYDRNELSISVDGRIRAIRRDLDRQMELDTAGAFTIGGGYAGGFDTFIMSGIVEDDADAFTIDAGLDWNESKGQVVKKDAAGKAVRHKIHFRNRMLDVQYHKAPVEITFVLRADQNVKRVVRVGMSGNVTQGSE